MLHQCFDYHSLKTRRRIPRIYSFSNGIFWSYNACRCQAIEKEQKCDKGEGCRYAHCKEEIAYHPSRYKTQQCSYPLRADGSCSRFGMHCFGDDTRVLTSDGFLFRHEIEQRLADGQQLQYAAYDSASQALVYCNGLFSRYENRDRALLNFTSAREAASWEAAVGKSGDDDTHLSVRVTPGHDMYLQEGECGKEADSPVHWATEGGQLVPAKKMRADTAMLQSCRCSETDGASCERCRSFVRFTAVARAGVRHAEPLLFPPERPSVQDELQHYLSLQSQTQIDAFMQIYGQATE